MEWSIEWKRLTGLATNRATATGSRFHPAGLGHHIRPSGSSSGLDPGYRRCPPYCFNIHQQREYGASRSRPGRTPTSPPRPRPRARPSASHARASPVPVSRNIPPPPWPALSASPPGRLHADESSRASLRTTPTRGVSRWRRARRMFGDMINDLEPRHCA
jgi:hypothetical protein